MSKAAPRPASAAKPTRRPYVCSAGAAIRSRLAMTSAQRRSSSRPLAMIDMSCTGRPCDVTCTKAIGRLQAVEPFAALSARLYQARPLQDAEMLHHGWPRDVEVVRDGLD